MKTFKAMLGDIFYRMIFNTWELHDSAEKKGLPEIEQDRKYSEMCKKIVIKRNKRPECEHNRIRTRARVVLYDDQMVSHAMCVQKFFK